MEKKKEKTRHTHGWRARRSEKSNKTFGLKIGRKRRNSEITKNTFWWCVICHLLVRVKWNGVYKKLIENRGNFFFGCHSVLMDSFYFGGQIITANATSYAHILKNEKISNGRRKTKLSQTIMKYLFL